GGDRRWPDARQRLDRVADLRLGQAALPGRAHRVGRRRVDVDAARRTADRAAPAAAGAGWLNRRALVPADFSGATGEQQGGDPDSNSDADARHRDTTILSPFCGSKAATPFSVPS